MNNPYDILGVPRGASKEELKKAYRKKAMVLHPDRNPDSDSHLKFIELTEAYEQLTEGKPIRQQPQQPASARYGTAQSDDLEERMRRAKAYAQRKAQMEFEKIERDHHQLKASKMYRLSKWVAVASMLMGTFMCIDFFGPKERYAAEITAMKRDRNIIYTATFNNESSSTSAHLMFVTPHPELTMYDKFEIELTSILREPIRIHATEKPLGRFSGTMEYLNYGRKNAYTIYRAMFFIVLILFLPVINYFLNQRKPAFYFFVYVNTILPLIMMTVIGIWTIVV